MIQKVSCNKSAYVSTVFNYELIINQLLMIQVLQEHRFFRKYPGVYEFDGRELRVGEPGPS
jgi:hypothetical protein